MVYHELQSAGAEAAHVATHSLHPSMAGTNIFGGGDDTLKDLVAAGLDGVADGLTPGDVVSSLFAQIGCATSTPCCCVDAALRFCSRKVATPEL